VIDEEDALPCLHGEMHEALRNHDWGHTYSGLFPLQTGASRVRAGTGEKASELVVAGLSHISPERKKAMSSEEGLTHEDIQQILDTLNMGGQETGEESNGYKRFLAEVKEKLHNQGLYLYYDPNANDLEGEWKVIPLRKANR
jgi:hypothetical protein